MTGRGSHSRLLRVGARFGSQNPLRISNHSNFMCAALMPPLFDLGLLKCAESFRHLLLARRNLQTEIGELLANRRISQGSYHCGIELGNNILRRAFGSKKRVPWRHVEA